MNADSCPNVLCLDELRLSRAWTLPTVAHVNGYIVTTSLGPRLVITETMRHTHSTELEQASASPSTHRQLGLQNGWPGFSWGDKRATYRVNQFASGQIGHSCHSREIEQRFDWIKGRSNHRRLGLITGSLALPLSHMVAKKIYLHQGGVQMLAPRLRYKRSFLVLVLSMGGRKRRLTAEAS